VSCSVNFKKVFLCNRFARFPKKLIALLPKFLLEWTETYNIKALINVSIMCNITWNLDFVFPAVLEKIPGEMGVMSVHIQCPSAPMC